METDSIRLRLPVGFINFAKNICQISSMDVRKNFNDVKIVRVVFNNVIPFFVHLKT